MNDLQRISLSLIEQNKNGDRRRRKISRQETSKDQPESAAQRPATKKSQDLV
ncbi:MAG: hypothetical protein OEQ74_01950 [Gammaproteobacteria bacterium]|nr:hypothetical protein [Gammaproteobacteria bacterium]